MPNQFRLTQDFRETVQIVFFVILLFWNVGIALVSLALYWLLIKVFKINWLYLLATGILLLLVVALTEMVSPSGNVSWVTFYHYATKINLRFWKNFFFGNQLEAFTTLLKIEHNQMIGLGIFGALGFLLIERFLPQNPHLLEMVALQQGDIQEHENLISDKKLEKKLNELDVRNYDGTVLGISKITGNEIVISNRELNHVMMVLGTIGSGKTITLRRFFEYAIRMGFAWS